MHGEELRERERPAPCRVGEGAAERGEVVALLCVRIPQGARRGTNSEDVANELCRPACRDGMRRRLQLRGDKDRVLRGRRTIRRHLGGELLAHAAEDVEQRWANILWIPRGRKQYTALVLDRQLAER